MKIKRLLTRTHLGSSDLATCRTNPFPKVAGVPNGTTLIELLFVLAVVSILVALLLPAICRAKASAHRLRCKSNLRQLGTAAYVYASDAGRFPTILEWLYDYPVEGQGDLTTGQLYPYLNSKAIYTCPSDASAATHPLTNAVRGATSPHSYYMNCTMCHAHDVTACSTPAKTAWFLEGTNLSARTLDGLADLTVFRAQFFSRPAFRHNRRTLVLMVDSHAESLSASQFGARVEDREFRYPNAIDRGP